jgi:hypothetical protein
MAKESGLGWTRCEVDNAATSAQEMRNECTSLEFSTPINTQEVTGLDKYAIERLALLADYTGTLNGVFNPAANKSHAVFGGNLRVPRTLGLTISAQILNAEVLITDYALNRANSGEFTWKVPYALQDGTAPTWTT